MGLYIRRAALNSPCGGTTRGQRQSLVVISEAFAISLLWLSQRDFSEHVPKHLQGKWFFLSNLHTGNMKRMNATVKRLISDQITISKALLNAFC